jgi:hypothetical protein
MSRYSVVLFFVLISGIIFLSNSQASTDPNLVLVSNTGKAGDRIGFVVSGYNVHGQVTLYWDKERQPIGYGIPLYSPGFFTVPEYASLGIHKVRADGVCGGIEVVWGCSASANFTVVSDKISDLSYQKTIPPLKQFKSGVKAEDVKCNTGFLLAIKLDYSPACVKESSAIKLYLRGWTFGFANYQEVYLMKPNSTAEISVKYYPQNYQGQLLPDETVQLYSRIYDIRTNSGFATYGTNATARPDFVHTNSNTIVNYTVMTGNAKGVYWLSLLRQCEVIPITVGLDGQELTTSDLQNPGSAVSCPAPEVQFHVVGLSNAILKLVHQ